LLDALHTCETALVLDPDLAEAHNLRGILLEELGRGREALAAYREAVRLDPDLVEAQENLSEAEAELGEQAEVLSVSMEDNLLPGEELSWTQAWTMVHAQRSAPVEDISLPRARLSWIQVWTLVLAQPSVAAFQILLRDPQVSATRGYRWVLISSTVGNAILWLVGYSMLSSEIGNMSGTYSAFLRSALCFPFVLVSGGLGAILGLAIRAGVTHWIARALGGTGRFPELVYAIAAYAAPLAIIVRVAIIIPYVGLLISPVAISSIVLNVMAVKAVHRFGWGKAIGASLLSLTLQVTSIIVVAVLLFPAW
jgi:tetratricopeptide (TPR) repeat protein